MKNYMMVNGKKIELSDETVSNLMKQLGNYVTEIGDVYRSAGGSLFMLSYIGNDGYVAVQLTKDVGYCWDSPTEEINDAVDELTYVGKFEDLFSENS